MTKRFWPILYSSGNLFKNSRVDLSVLPLSIMIISKSHPAGNYSIDRRQFSKISREFRVGINILRNEAFGILQ